MFHNLYFQSRSFREFNRNDSFGQVEAASQAYLIGEMRSSYELGEPDPCFLDAIACSLRAETAHEYLKSVRLPVTQRDFLLSKLFQFLFMPLRIQGQLDKPDALPLRRQLEHWLSSLPQAAIMQLHRFNWHLFFEDSNRIDRSRLLARLDRYLPATKTRRARTPGMGRRGPVPDVAHHQRIARIVQAQGSQWTRRPGLRRVAEALDDVPVTCPQSWANLDPPATSWRSAVESHPRRVVKILKYSLEMASDMHRRLEAVSGKAKGRPASARTERPKA